VSEQLLVRPCPYISQYHGLTAVSAIALDIHSLRLASTTYMNSTPREKQLEGYISTAYWRRVEIHSLSTVLYREIRLKQAIPYTP